MVTIALPNHLWRDPAPFVSAISHLTREPCAVIISRLIKRQQITQAPCVVVLATRLITRRRCEALRAARRQQRRSKSLPLLRKRDLVATVTVPLSQRCVAPLFQHQHRLTATIRTQTASLVHPIAKILVRPFVTTRESTWKNAPVKWASSRHK